MGWYGLDAPFLRAAVDTFPKRLKACIDANGHIFESQCCDLDAVYLPVVSLMTTNPPGTPQNALRVSLQEKQTESALTDREMKGVFVDGWTLRTGEHHSFAVRSVDVTHHVRTAVERLEAVLKRSL